MRSLYALIVSCSFAAFTLVPIPAVGFASVPLAVNYRPPMELLEPEDLVHDRRHSWRPKRKR
jgi:hypothetical protein